MGVIYLYHVVYISVYANNLLAMYYICVMTRYRVFVYRIEGSFLGRK